jgi:hypothetical protein
LPFVVRVLDSAAVEKGDHVSVIAQLKVRNMTTALSCPTELGFSHLLEISDLERIDTVYKNLNKLATSLVDALQSVEFKDTDQTQPIVDAWSVQWKAVFVNLDEVGAFNGNHTFVVEKLADGVTALMIELATAFSKHYVKVFQDICAQNPWLEKVFKNKALKFVWPNDFAEVAESTTSQMVFATKFLESTAADVLDSNDMEKFREARHALVCINVGKHRRDANDLIKAKAKDASIMRKRADMLETYFDILCEVLDATFLICPNSDVFGGCSDVFWGPSAYLQQTPIQTNTFYF